jgi:hypothetical protein
MAEFRNLLVENLNWSALLDIAPVLRRTVRTGLLLDRRARKSKGKGPANFPLDAAVVSASFKKDLVEEFCLNFFKKAVILVNNREYEVDKVLIDAGSVVNLASLSLLETIGAALSSFRP